MKALILGSIICNGLTLRSLTNKVFIVFTPEETLLDTNTFSISKSFFKIGLLWP